ncbi:MAG: CBS domain-containing protein [Acidobacteriota bacterium]
MNVSDYMTVKVFTLVAGKKLFIALDIMNWAHVRHVPVVDRAGRVVGLISHRDVLRASISALSTTVANLERDQHLWTIPIESVMSKDVQTIAPDADVRQAAKLMRESKIGCLPVVENEKLVGIITEYDLLRLAEEYGGA